MNNTQTGLCLGGFGLCLLVTGVCFVLHNHDGAGVFTLLAGIVVTLMGILQLEQEHL